MKPTEPPSLAQSAGDKRDRLRLAAVESTARPSATFRDYVAIARPDHWIKHLFILPGVALAWLLRSSPLLDRWPVFAAGLISAAAIASANYVLNEWLDASFDRFHPTKSQRPGVRRKLSARIVGLEYVALMALGLGLAWASSGLLFVTCCLFALSGLAYNVRPVRLKDVAFLDVIAESVNNPLRLTIGWAMVDSATLPPGSVLLAYWMGGAYLMAIKRVAEFRTVAESGGRQALDRYRRSFRKYTASSLLVSAFIYAQLAAFFLGVFLIKYRIEYILALPLFAALFGIYFWIGLKPESDAQTPERLFRNHALLAMTALIIIAMAVLTWVDLPFLENLTTPHYIDVGGTGRE